MLLNIRLVSINARSLFLLTFILYVVSNAVPIWRQANSGGYVLTYGLWLYCSSYLGTQTCGAYQCPSDTDTTGYCSKLYTGRTFVTLACIMSGLVTICLYSFVVTRDKTNCILLLATKGLGFACVVMGIIGVAIGAKATQLLGQGGINCNLSAGAIIGIIAILVNFGGAIAALSVTKQL